MSSKSDAPEALVKTEPNFDEDTNGEELAPFETVLREHVHSDEVQSIKDEPKWEDDESLHGISEAAARAGLYTDHEVKDEIVLGPEVLQQHDAVHTLHGNLENEDMQTVGEEKASVSREVYSVTNTTVGYVILVPVVKPAETANVTQDTNPYKCSRCKFSTNRRYTLLIHAKKHTGEEPYKCNQCSFASDQKYNVRAHKRKHTGEKPYKCSYATDTKYYFVRNEEHTSVKFSSALEKDLSARELKHISKKYQCSHCTYSSSQKVDLQIHERKHTGEKPFKCTECDFACARKSYLLIHGRKHTGEKPYKCSCCSYASARKSDMIIHERTHTGDKPYKCNQCDFSCVRKSSLLIHKQRHTGEKPYKCSYCSYANAQKDRLLIHETKHTGERPFKCPECDFACASKSYLLIHERKHTGEKPYKCSSCSFATAYKSGMYVHKRTHNSVKPYKCDKCSFVSAYKSKLRVHGRMHIDENA